MGLEFKDENIKALTKRVLSYRDVFEGVETYPHDVMMLEFGMIIFFNKNEVLGRIRELCELLNYRIEVINSDLKLKIYEGEKEVK